jgi:uncharacterized membrane protein YuzA (DUF378 family)
MEAGMPLKKIDLVMSAIGVVGGVNYLSIASGRYDLIGKLAGKTDFGETNLASRTMYGIFGGAALWSLSRMLEQAV